MRKLLSGLYFAVILAVFVPDVTYGLQCYACASTGDANKCEDYNTYKNAFEKNDTRIAKVCGASYDTVCFIETFSDRGNTVSHIRDCGDGDTYSFNGNQMDEKGAYNILKALKPTNETRCVWDGLHQVCLSTCNETLCNGPQFENSAVRDGVTGLYLISAFIMAVLTIL